FCSWYEQTLDAARRSNWSRHARRSRLRSNIAVRSGCARRGQLGTLPPPDAGTTPPPSDAGRTPPPPADASQPQSPPDLGLPTADLALPSGDLSFPVLEPTDAPNFRIDAAHTGAQPLETIAPPLTMAWTANFFDAVSYPIVADNRVFVTAGFRSFSL